MRKFSEPGGRVDRLGLVDGRDLGDPDVGGVGQRVDRALEARQALAEVGPEGQHSPPDRAHLTGEGVRVDDVRVGRLGHGSHLTGFEVGR